MHIILLAQAPWQSLSPTDKLSLSLTSAPPPSLLSPHPPSQINPNLITLQHTHTLTVYQ